MTNITSADPDQSAKFAQSEQDLCMFANKTFKVNRYTWENFNKGLPVCFPAAMTLSKVNLLEIGVLLKDSICSLGI